ncbi:MAG: sugar transferase [Candidatus Omnitrophica bacterium]|nr:sugar transferase [Candidatus Omnitrophota bacterium]
MFKNAPAFFKRVLLVSDLILVTLAFYVGYQVRDSIGLFYGGDLVGMLYPFEKYLKLLPLVLSVWAAGLWFSGSYDSFRGRGFFDLTFGVCKAGVIATLLFGGAAYLLRLEFVSRIFISVVFFSAGALLVAERLVLFILMSYFRRRGYNTRRVLIVGTGRRACEFAELLARHPEWGLVIVGFIDKDRDRVGKTILGAKVIGDISDIRKFITKIVIDEVFFIVPHAWIQDIQQPMLYCEELGKRVNVAIDYFKLKKFARPRQYELAQFHLLTFETTSDDLIQLFLKRLMDIVASGVALFVLSPLFIVIALSIKAASKGPVFFSQMRSGLNGRTFKLYKFRTMVPDAEARLAGLRRLNEMRGPVFKMANDPRLTPIGKFLRTTSLDELPQLLNVFNGDMSLVGPRPPIPKEVERYTPWQRRRLSMRPGITCIWQACGRNRITDFDTWMKMDLAYIDRWSLWLDIKLLCKTIPAVLLSAGAK